MNPADPNSFILTLGHILKAAEIDASAILAIRHTYRPDGLGSRVEATPERILAYTREQLAKPGKIPANPPPWWFIFMAETGRRCRLATVYHNGGEIAAERTDTHRYFDLRDSDLLKSMRNRLLIEWSPDTVNWVKLKDRAAKLPIIEIADPQVVEFPGYDNVLISYGELQQVVVDSRYARWQAALGAVKGIYLIADTRTGKLYVGKADGGQRIFGRWSAYAKDGHGGNVAMRQLIDLNPDQPTRYRFSLLRVFGPQAPQAEVDAAEEHFKKALQTRTFGLNRN